VVRGGGAVGCWMVVRATRGFPSAAGFPGCLVIVLRFCYWYGRDAHTTGRIRIEENGERCAAREQERVEPVSG